MSNIVSLKYPKKSHRKQVTIPKHSTMLAEFFGIMMGDGSINNDWQANITLNLISDAKYAEYIKTLCKKLFNSDLYEPFTRIDPRDCQNT